MKKSIILSVLALILSVTFVSCGDKSSSSASTEASQATDSPSEALKYICNVMASGDFETAANLVCNNRGELPQPQDKAQLISMWQAGDRAHELNVPININILNEETTGDISNIKVSSAFKYRPDDVRENTVTMRKINGKWYMVM